MDNLRRLVSHEEVSEFLGEQWKTDIFRDAHDHGCIKRLVTKVAEYPLLVADVRGAVERSHFLAMLGVLPLRPEEYVDAPYIADLYIMHELAHMAGLEYDLSHTEDDWKAGIFENEREASLTTEVCVYFEMPDLRSCTFPFQIWADRFLENKEVLDSTYPDNKRLFFENRDMFWRVLSGRRLRAMTTPISGDPNEMLIAGYSFTNGEWAKIWSSRRLEVAKMMTGFRKIATVDRADALIFLEEWLKRSQGDNPIPFYDEAVQFSRVLHLHRECSNDGL